MHGEKRTYFVYIIASNTKIFYNGVTSSLFNRILHLKKDDPRQSFTKRYHVNRLVYFEEYNNLNEAIARDKQIKKWQREKKIELIESVNPDWHDLFYELEHT